MQVIGLMSGSSLDGLDLAAVEISHTSAGFEWAWIACETKSYPEIWRLQLETARQLSAPELAALDMQYGKWLGQAVQDFCQQHRLTPQLIASHGHTVWHQPGAGFSLQIGNGEAMCAVVNLPVVTQFRIRDIALGGQGAPLVPAGELALLNTTADAFLNLGGIANLHIPQSGAWDVCPCNQLLNRLAAEAGQPFDPNGEIATQGQLLPDLLEKLCSLPWHLVPPPKSLGNEDVASIWMPILQTDDPTADKLHTTCHYIAHALTHAFGTFAGSVLVSGGGAHNHFLMQTLRTYGAEKGVGFIVADAQLTDYKEALLFAWLGYCAWYGLPNCLAQYTGARHDSRAGSIHLPSGYPVRSAPIPPSTEMI